MLTHHSHLLYTCVCMLSHLSCVRLYATLWIAHQSSLSMGFSGQEYWSGIPCPPPGMSGLLLSQSLLGSMPIETENTGSLSHTYC